MPADGDTLSLNAFKEAALSFHSCRGRADRREIDILILRGAFDGSTTFEEFQGGLGIARNILSDRLAKWSGRNPERSPDPSDGRKVVYSLTAKGEGLLAVVLALRQWGDDGVGKLQIVLADRRDGKPVRRFASRRTTGEN